MRVISGLLLLIGTVVLAQEPRGPVEKFGIKSSPDIYTQKTVAESLGSVIRTIEKDKFEYLAAHLLDPKFVETKINERIPQLEPAVERELRLTRDSQIQAGLPARERLPSDAKEFAAAVLAETKLRAFKLLARDIRTHYTENPDLLKSLKKYQRIGVVVEAGETGNVTLKEVKDIQLNFKRVDGVWTMENRKSTTEEKK
ncbi:MAG: hypothetical protein ACRC8S_08300 [Fimbriiglobus sp.]